MLASKGAVRSFAEHRSHGPRPSASGWRTASAGVQSRLLVAVDDPTAIEVVGAELHLDAVAEHDADAVAAHAAGRVADGLVAVVERDPEHAVAQGLRDLALELDGLFLGADGFLLSGVASRTRASGGRF